MGTKKCVICYSDQSHFNIKSTNSKASILNQQLVAIFLVRKIFKIPQEVCVNLLKDYGNPCQWIFWCDSCSSLVEKTKSIHDQILLLRKQFQTLEVELQTTVQLSERTFREIPESRLSSKKKDSEWGATEIVREYFTQHENAKKDDLITEFKTEVVDFDCDNDEKDVCEGNESQDLNDVSISGSRHEGVYSPDINPVASSSLKVEIGDKILSAPLQNSFLYKDESLNNLLVKMDNIIYSKSCNVDDDITKFGETNRISTTEHKKRKGTGSEISANSTGSLETQTKSFSIRLPRIPVPIKNCQQSSNIDQDYGGSDIYKADDCCESDNSDVYEPEADQASESDDLIDKPRRSARRQSSYRKFKTEKKFKCELCSHSYTSIYTLKEHCVKMHGELPFPCDKCKLKFLNECELEKHAEKSHSTAHKFSCPKCNKRFMVKSSVRNHCKEKHAKEFHILFPAKRAIENGGTLAKPYSCQKCRKKYMYHKSLLYHLKKDHAQDYPSLKMNEICDVCQEKFEGKWKLKSHYEKEHPDHFKSKYFYGKETIFYPCPHCPFKTANQNYLLVHISKHSEKPGTENISTVEEQPNNNSHSELHYQPIQSSPRNESPDFPVNEENFSQSGEEVGGEKGTSSLEEVEGENARKEKIFKCEMCVFSNKRLCYLREHFLKLHGELPFHCEKCFAKMVNEEELKLHNKKCNWSEIKKFSCPKCVSKTYVNERDLRNHFTKEHPNDEVSFRKRRALPRLPTEELFVPCEKCGKRFANMASRDQHYKSAHPEDTFETFRKKNKTCDICNIIFATMRNLKSHFKEKHPKEFQLRYSKAKYDDTGKVYPCPHCPFTTKSNSYLQHHIKKHSIERPYICDLCGVTFKNKNMLREHRHSKHYEELGLEPYKCPHCGKMFETPGYLQIHINSHLGQFKYNCTICNKGYNFKTLLEQHTLRHKGEKPNLCHECGKSFVSKCSLTVHIKGVHFKQKSFHCKKCTKSFSSGGRLKRHEQGVHSDGTNPYKCKICHKTFPVRNYLYIHMRSHKRRGEVPWGEEGNGRSHNAIKILTQN